MCVVPDAFQARPDAPAAAAALPKGRQVPEVRAPLPPTQDDAASRSDTGHGTATGGPGRPRQDGYIDPDKVCMFWGWVKGERDGEWHGLSSMATGLVEVVHSVNRAQRERRTDTAR